MARYRPKLKNLLNLAETSYMMLTRLLAPMSAANGNREFYIGEQLAYRITVLEQTAYTQVVRFEQLIHSAESLASKVYIPKPAMTIRLYHDARIVEVIESQHIKRIKPRYDYPNQQMHLPDEKRQTLLFLSEWLQLCLKHGRANIQLKT